MKVSNEEVERILRLFDISDDYIGFDILTFAIMYMIKCEDKPKIMKVYEQIAKEYDITVANVEKNIRRSIKKAWENYDYNLMQHKYFGGIYGVHNYPRNGQFLQRMRIFLITGTFTNN